MLRLGLILRLPPRAAGASITNIEGWDCERRVAVRRVIDQIADKDVKAAEVVIEKFERRPV